MIQNSDSLAYHSALFKSFTLFKQAGADNPIILESFKLLIEASVCSWRKIALSNEILNKSESIELAKIEHELSSLKVKKTSQKLKYDQEKDIDKQDYILELLLETNSSINKKTRRLHQIEENLKERTYIAEDINELEKNPVKLNQLFNLLNIKMIIKDRTVSFKNIHNETTTVEYLGYKYKEDGFAISQNFLDLEMFDLSKLHKFSKDDIKKANSGNYKETKIILRKEVKELSC